MKGLKLVGIAWILGAYVAFLENNLKGYCELSLSVTAVLLLSVGITAAVFEAGGVK